MYHFPLPPSVVQVGIVDYEPRGKETDDIRVCAGVTHTDNPNCPIAFDAAIAFLSENDVGTAGMPLSEVPVGVADSCSCFSISGRLCTTLLAEDNPTMCLQYMHQCGPQGGRKN